MGALPFMRGRDFRIHSMKLLTPLALAVIALLSLAAGLFGVRAARTSPAAFALEITLASSATGRAQLFYDRGRGMSEAESVWLTVVRSERALTYRLPLPAGRYTGFRFDPLDRYADFRIVGAPRLVSSAGRVVRPIALSSFTAAHQIASLRVEGESLRVTVEPGGGDPQLSFECAPPAVLELTGAELAAVFAVRGLGTFLVLAGILAILGRGLSAPAESSYGQRWAAALRAAPAWLVVAVCAGIVYARQPERLTHPQFWAEDSVIFYQGALLRGWDAFIDPYAGYHHLVPRLTAAAAQLVHPKWAPTLFALVSLGGTLYVAARTLSARCPLPRHPGYALAVVLVPEAWEVLLNICNLQWFFFGGFALLLISRDPARWWQVAHDALIAVLLGLTGPFSIVFAPLFLWRAAVRRTTASAWLAVLVGLCAAVQLWTIWRNPMPVDQVAIAYQSALAAPGMRLTAALFVGAFVPADYPLAVESLLGVVAIAGLGALALRRGPLRQERIWLAAAALLLLAVSLYRCRFTLPELCHAGFATRYFYPILMIVLWLLLAATADARRWVARGAAVVLVWALAVNLPRLRVEAYPDFRWQDQADAILTGQAVEIPVNPEGWAVRLPERKR